MRQCLGIEVYEYQAPPVIDNKPAYYTLARRHLYPAIFGQVTAARRGENCFTPDAITDADVASFGAVFLNWVEGAVYGALCAEDQPDRFAQAQLLLTDANTAIKEMHRYFIYNRNRLVFEHAGIISNPDLYLGNPEVLQAIDRDTKAIKIVNAALDPEYNDGLPAEPETLQIQRTVPVRMYSIEKILEEHIRTPILARVEAARGKQIPLFSRIDDGDVVAFRHFFQQWMENTARCHSAMSHMDERVLTDPDSAIRDIHRVLIQERNWQAFRFAGLTEDQKSSRSNPQFIPLIQRYNRVIKLVNTALDPEFRYI